MPVWLIKAFPYLIAIAVFAGYTVFIDDFGYERGKAAAEKTCKEETVPAAKKLIQDQCDANTLIATEACNALQTRYDAIDTRYNRLLKQTNSGKCVAITSAPGGAVQGAGATLQPVPDRGVEWGSLVGLGRDNDRTAARLVTLQSVVCAIYKNNKREDLLPQGACVAP